MPRLVDETNLEATAVVANSAMNRGRGLRGVNSYARELGFDPLDALISRLQPGGDHEVSWLDLGCGRGRSLAEAAGEVEKARLATHVSIVGVDLVDSFEPIERPWPGLRFVAASLGSWMPDQTFDLVTCVHGLHYIGDKLGFLARIASWLTADGLFVADFDLASIRLENGQPARRAAATALRTAGFTYESRRHRLSLLGGRTVHLPYTFVGSDPDAGPNYTGQPAVHSYYSRPD